LDNDAVEALCDALLATRPDISNQVLEIRSSGLPLVQGFRAMRATAMAASMRVFCCRS
jgi:hypothetical protein